MYEPKQLSADSLNATTTTDNDEVHQIWKVNKLTKQPQTEIMRMFQQLGLDVSTQKFVLRYNIGPDIKISGKNIYGILRARRHSSKESFVLAVPYRQINSTFTDTNGGIALVLALAKDLRSASFLAKDIIFLISDHEYLGVQAWLEPYHRVAPDAGLIDSEDLQL
ncbi:hypothetical protein QYM36_004991 [Artemia franciscana]|uniref:Uncharacterized protein n=1 Tax=Artemia franciscana TaxID=6661 RepID=A0AA88I1N8_ARTSF|nr:hypothetical protein QYM36_004991 [Artemia franciscana]